jgi:gliding motility-associated-like protein
MSFGIVDDSGYYFIWAEGAGGCNVLMNGRTHIIETPLIAVDDYFYLKVNELRSDFNVLENDILLEGVDLVPENIKIKLLDEKDIIAGGPVYNRPIGMATIDDLGFLTYSKLPSFYGIDSLTYRITNTEIPGRSDEAKVYIMVGNETFEDFSFLLPNAFSPNGDGINDYFVIDGLGDTETSMLEVFNRWGTIVYRSKGNNYKNDWDGKTNLKAFISVGDELPSGTYYYIFKVKKNINGSIVSKEFKGFVELRR